MSACFPCEAVALSYKYRTARASYLAPASSSSSTIAIASSAERMRLYDAPSNSILIFLRVNDAGQLAQIASRGVPLMPRPIMT